MTDWKPPEMSDELFTRDFERFGSPPDALKELYIHRDVDAVACLASCDEILAKDPENCSALFYKGNILTEQKRYAEALPYLVKLTGIVPLIYIVWEYRGICEISLGDAAAARDSFMTEGCIAPHLAFPVCNIALSYYLEDKHEAALYFLDQMIELGRVEDMHLLAWLKGFMQEKKGEKSEAFLSYFQSQLMAKSDEEKQRAALNMYEITSKIIEDPDEERES